MTEPCKFFLNVLGEKRKKEWWGREGGREGERENESKEGRQEGREEGRGRNCKLYLITSGISVKIDYLKG